MKMTKPMCPKHLSAFNDLTQRGPHRPLPPGMSAAMMYGQADVIKGICESGKACLEYVPFTEDGTIGPAGDVGGDVQDGPAFDRRWISRGADGIGGTVITLAVYPAREESTDGTERTWIQVQAEWIECTDVTEPGDTETDRDYRYWDGYTGDDAESVARALNLEDVHAALDQMAR